METKDFSHVQRGRFRPGQIAAGRKTRRRDERLGAGAALLGVVCVAGVFALLGLLYAFG